MRRELAFAALVCAAAALFLAEAREPRPPIDDAFISYRYARNLVAGQGLVYNPGEYVEGYTNLLWTLLVAAGVALGGRAPDVGFALGLASGVLALLATAGYARCLLEVRQRWLAGLAPLLLLAAPVFSRWATSGLETPLFVALVAAALWAFARDRVGLASAGAFLATLCRPDGVLLAAALLGLHLAPRWREPRAWRAPLAYTALLVGLTLFRLLYYGSPLPNTFYAKVGGLPLQLGVLHVLDFLGSGVWLLLPPAALALLRDARARPGALYAALVVAYVVAIGGDAFRWRFLLPVLPWLASAAVSGTLVLFAASPWAGAAAVLCLVASVCRQSLGELPIAVLAGSALLAAGLVAALRMRGVAARWIAALPALLLAAALATPSLRGALLAGARESERARYLAQVREIDRAIAAGGRLAAGALLARGEPSPLIAAGAIGALGYYSRLPILDIYGLVDATIARSRGDAQGRVVPGHTRSNADYVLGRRPDYIFIRQRAAALASGTPQAIRDLWQHPDLERLYVWDEGVSAYRRRDR